MLCGIQDSMNGIIQFPFTSMPHGCVVHHNLASTSAWVSCGSVALSTTSEILSAFFSHPSKLVCRESGFGLLYKFHLSTLSSRAIPPLVFWIWNAIKTSEILI